MVTQVGTLHDSNAKGYRTSWPALASRTGYSQEQTLYWLQEVQIGPGSTRPAPAGRMESR